MRRVRTHSRDEGPGRLHRIRPMLPGFRAEWTNLVGLVVINLGFAYLLGARGYGVYSLTLGSAMAVIGLLDQPRSWSMQTSTVPPRMRDALKKAVPTTGLTLGVALIVVADQGIVPVLGSVLFAAGFSGIASSQALAYRVHRLDQVARISMAGFGSTLVALVPAALQDEPELVILVHSCAVFVTGTSCLIASRWDRSEHHHRRPTLAVVAVTRYVRFAFPALVTALSQWFVVFVVSISNGPADAGVARVGTSLFGITAAVLPMSGQFFYSVVTDRQRGPGARTLLRYVLVVGAAVSIGVAVTLAVALPRISSGYGDLSHILVVIPFGAVGLSLFTCGWLFIAELPSGGHRRAVIYVTFACAVAGVGVLSSRSQTEGLLGLGAMYAVLGTMVLLAVEQVPDAEAEL